MLFLLQAAPLLPPTAPWWGAAILAVVLATISTVGLVYVARAQRRAGGDDLGERVRKLEEEEPAELAKVREVADKAADDARTATESAERVAGDLKKHVEDEEKRRERAREIGQGRDEKLTQRLEDLKERVVEQGAQLKVLEGRVETGGASRRGR